MINTANNIYKILLRILGNFSIGFFSFNFLYKKDTILVYISVGTNITTTENRGCPYLILIDNIDKPIIAEKSKINRTDSHIPLLLYDAKNNGTTKSTATLSIFKINTNC